MNHGNLLRHKSESMDEVWFVSDLDQCRRLWNDLISVRNISDLWDFRYCFQRHFNARPCFLVRKDSTGIAGMLPLSYLEEERRFVFFPGETWKQKNWIERTPIFLRYGECLESLLRACPEGTHLRYMEPLSHKPNPNLVLDEKGYVLYPGEFDFNIDYYARRFSAKKFKNLKKAVESFTMGQSSFYINRVEDFDTLVDMSVRRYKDDSYLFDPRFRESFRDVMILLKQKGWLHMVSLEIEGKTAAVDLGAKFNGCYTVFLGGTLPEFPGIAKAMNMYHVAFAFENKFRKIDFLCGDFNWKKLWHLDEEPLYYFGSPECLPKPVIEQTSQRSHWDSYRASRIYA